MPFLPTETELGVFFPAFTLRVSIGFRPVVRRLCRIFNSDVKHLIFLGRRTGSVLTFYGETSKSADSQPQ